MIIFLNGVSSSGKSSVAKALQHLLEEPYLHIGIDWMMKAMPKRYWCGDGAQEGFGVVQTTDSKGPLAEITCGSYGQKLEEALRETIFLLYSLGHNLIIDHVVLADETKVMYETVLENTNTLFVHVESDEQSIIEREILRGDRVKGMGRAQLKILKHFDYDLTVNTSKNSPFECARQIIKCL